MGDEDGSDPDHRAGQSARAQAAAEVARASALADAYGRALAHSEGYGAAGLSEPMTATALHQLRTAGWRILHDRRWPGSTRANIDHLTIGPTGVAVLDTKHWAEPVEVRQDRLWSGDLDCQEDVEKLLRQVAAIEELLEEVSTSAPGVAVGLSPIHIVPMMVFTRQPPARVPHPRLGRVRLTTLQTLATTISRLPRVLAPDQVALVAEYLAREMPPSLDPTAIPAPRKPDIGLPVRPEPSPPPEPAERPEFAQLFAVEDLEAELARAAAQPMVEWMGFLHPSQARLVRRCFNGPARVRGPAGTGKTVVMLHRAAWLATIRPGRILVTSFVRTLIH